MSDFDSIFNDEIEKDLDFDTIFGTMEDGELIDNVAGFREDGSCETDFDELHQIDDDTCPKGMADELGPGNDCNAPSGSEGTDGDPIIDLASGVSHEGEKEFSANGENGKSEADDFYKDVKKEPTSAVTGEGPDVDMKEEDQESEFDKMMKEAGIMGNYKGDDDELTNEEHVGLDKPSGAGDFDAYMQTIDNDPKPGAEGTDEGPDYEEGDADLIDLVAGDD